MFRTRSTDWRTSASTSLNDSIANGGAMPGGLLQLGAEAIVA